MSTNVEVSNSETENSLGLRKKFTRKVQGSGVLKRARSIRYKARQLSDFKKKKATLKSLAKKKEVDRLIKLGKIQDTRNRPGKR